MTQTLCRKTSHPCIARRRMFAPPGRSNLLFALLLCLAPACGEKPGGGGGGKDSGANGNHDGAGTGDGASMGGDGSMSDHDGSTGGDGSSGGNDGSLNLSDGGGSNPNNPNNMMID